MRSGSLWTKQAKLVASDGSPADSFGKAISIDEDYIIIGAYSSDISKGSAYIFNMPSPDLKCEGNISWSDVKPGEIVAYYFTVENIGEPNSRLEWIVEDYSESGGNWESQPIKGMLTPEDDPMTVEVSFEAPDEQNKEFNGVIKVVAVGDPDDFYEIPITVITPRYKVINNPILNFFKCHPNLFPIL
jgi:hypothetical protein